MPTWAKWTSSMPGMARLWRRSWRAKDAVKGVQGATDALAAQLSASSVEGIRKVFAEHAGQLQSLKSGMWYAAAIVAVSALVNVAVFVLRGVR
ncbi:MAG: hypothetical protein ACLU6O_05470 [Bilophila wadsworthia]